MAWPENPDLRADSCSTWVLGDNYPRGMNPARAPPGWEDPPAQLESAIVYRVYECEQISWGPFERGPVTFVMQVHSNIRVPEACRQAGQLAYALIMWFGITDAEIAAWARESLRLPAAEAVAEKTITSDAGAERTTWSWKPAEGDFAPSTAEWVHVSAQEQDVVFEQRFFWQTGESSIAYFDLSADGREPVGDPPVAVGTLRPPMHSPTAPGGRVVGLAWSAYDSNVAAQATFFGDLRCEKPRPAPPRE